VLLYGCHCVLLATDNWKNTFNLKTKLSVTSNLSLSKVFKLLEVKDHKQPVAAAMICVSVVIIPQNWYGTERLRASRTPSERLRGRVTEHGFDRALDLRQSLGPPRQVPGRSAHDMIAAVSTRRRWSYQHLAALSQCDSRTPVEIVEECALTS
jgi:hypothetical protein